MTTEQFKDYCNRNGSSFEEIDGRLIVTSEYSFDLGNFKKLPKNLTFRNKGYVNLNNVEEILESTLFENDGDVYMKADVKIPEKYKGFKNKGNISPENLKLKTPVIKYKFSSELESFLSENYHANDIAKKFLNLNGYPIKEDAEQQTMFDFSGPDDIAFLPVRNLIKIYKKAIEVDAEISKRGIENWMNRNKTSLLKEASKNVVKIGRFIKKLFPEITDAETEAFVNLYKSYKNNNEYEFELLKGDDIITSYYRGNQDTGQNTTLYNSCMNWVNDTDTHPHNHRNIKKMLEFYSKNPNCEILVLRLKNADLGESEKRIVVEQDPANPIRLKKDGTPDRRFKNHTDAVVKEQIVATNFRKIRGRALIWHDNERDIHYMEYIYTTKGSENVMYENYAKEKGWITYNTKYEDDLNKKFKKISIPVPKEIADKGRISESKELPTYLDSLYYDDINKLVHG